MEDGIVMDDVNSGVRKISTLSLSNFASESTNNVILPSYDEESAPLVSRDKIDRPRGMGNLVESKLESEAPMLEGSTAHCTSNCATMMHLLKGNIGTGILAMPNAVSNAGLAVGTIGIPVLGVFSVHCMHLLVSNSKILARKIGCTHLDYPNTVEQAFRLGPKPLRFMAPIARFAVNLMLMLTQFGFCCVYFLFVSKSLYEVVYRLRGSSSIKQVSYMAILLPFMIIFNLVRSLKNLSPFSSIANVLQSCGLCVVMYFLLSGKHSKNLNAYSTDIKKLPLYFGTAMYAFEGIGVVLPLENAMATPEDFGGLNGVLNTGMTIVACLYTAVGFYGYLKYGDDVKSSITFNLPDGIVSEIVRLTFAIAIFLSYPLQLYVPISIIWPYLKEKSNIEQYSDKKQRILEYILRAFLVTVTFVLAWIIPLLHLFISLVGALASSSLALIFPPIVNILVNWSNPEITKKQLILSTAKDIFLITFGLFGSVVGTFTASKEIARCLKNPIDSTCQL